MYKYYILCVDYAKKKLYHKASEAQTLCSVVSNISVFTRHALSCYIEWIESVDDFKGLILASRAGSLFACSVSTNRKSLPCALRKSLIICLHTLLQASEASSFTACISK